MSESTAAFSARFGKFRAVICDALVFLMNLLLAKPMLHWLTEGAEAFDDSGKSQGTTPLGWIILAALVSYSLGCWLKRGPLQARTGGSQPEAAGCLILAWLSLMASLTILGGAVVMADLSMNSDNGWNMLLLFVIALTPIVLGVRAMGAGNVRGLPAWRTSLWLEVIADLLIIAAILPVSIIWQEWVSGLFSQNLAGEGWGTRLFACIMSLGAFALFYFAPRLVLVYDRLKDKFMWGTFAFAAFPSVRACLFP
jgi:hypothetical protein